MTRQLLRRILFSILMMLFLTLFVFLLSNMVNGNAIDTMIG